MKKFLWLSWLIVSVNIQAQNITGLVMVSNNKSPVAYASVGLLHMPDSSLTAGGITLMSGKYTFENVKPGDYFVQVNYLGYALAGTHVKVEDASGITVADTIFLYEASHQLEEAVIKGQRLQGQELVDRTVYSIPEEVAKSSNTGYDILKKIPQVQVDFQNNVTMNGSTNFIIQVDGKQRDKEFLARLLPSDIKTIEIISNPSGKYEGNIDGVINIILKKEARYGMNGNVAMYLKPINKPTVVTSGSLDYGMGNITFYVTAFAFTQRLNIASKNYNRFSYNDSVSNMTGNGDIEVTVPSVNTGFDYYMNDKNNLSFNLTYKPIYQRTGLINSADLSNRNGEMSYLSSVTGSNLESNEGSLSLFYKKTFSKPVQEFSAESSYYLFNSEDGNNFTNTLFSYLSVPLDTQSRIENSINERSYFSTKLNYVHPIGMSTKAEAGYQLYYQQIDYDFTSNLASMSNRFNYSELRNSVYAGITINLKKIGLQGIVRIENTNSSVNDESTIDYYCVLPSANLQYKFSASHNLKFTYNRRINRPGIYDLNPFPKINASYNITQGNPELKPEYRDRLQLTYTWNFKKNYISPYVYYELLTDKTGMSNKLVESPIDNNLTILTKPFNLLSGNERGGGLNGMLWFVNLNARFYQGHFLEYNSQTTFIPSRDYSSFSITAQAFHRLEKQKLTGFAFLSYNGVSVNAQSKTYNLPFYGFGAQKEAGNHNFGFFWLLPFSKNVELNKTITETPLLYNKNVIGFDVSYYIQFSYAFKFNKGKSVKKLNRKAEIESDSKSGGIQGK
ncbi:MAG: TonB-dependent receptor [Bacteroidales bacterium]